MPEGMRILAIDPGYDRLGIAVLEGNASRPTFIMSHCIQPEKGTPEERLAHISKAVAAAISTYAPDALGLETLFFSTNKKTALGVAEARGAVLAAVGARGISVQEFSPGTVKLAVTGYGAADKSAVARMIPKLLTLPAKKRRDDELDAIAVALAGLSTPHAR